MINNYYLVYLILNLFSLYSFESIISTNNINLKLKQNNISCINNNISSINNNITTKKFRSKFCYIKCNCFPSHTVVNDNINVPNWKGLYSNNV
jgi:hypothetical protein